MDESSYGKFEETQKPEPLEENNKAVIAGLEQLKHGGNSEPVKEMHGGNHSDSDVSTNSNEEKEGGAKEKCLQVEKEEEHGGASQVASSESVEGRLPAFDEKAESTPIVVDAVPKGIKVNLSPSFDENAVTDVASEEKSGESSSAGDKKSILENVEDSSKASADASVADGVLESTPIASLRRRTQPASWRSCCGLFDVLRRSDG